MPVGVCDECRILDYTVPGFLRKPSGDEELPAGQAAELSSFRRGLPGAQVGSG